MLSMSRQSLSLFKMDNEKYYISDTENKNKNLIISFMHWHLYKQTYIVQTGFKENCKQCNTTDKTR